MIKKSNVCFLGVIVLIGVVLRIAYLNELYDNPIFRYPEIDALYHNYWAKGLVTDQWAPPLDHDYPAIQENVYFKPPGTPYFLAFVYFLFGISNIYPKIIFVILGIFSCLFMYFFVRRLFDELSGKAAALIFVTYWAFIYYEATFLEPTLTVFLNILCIFLVYRWIGSRGLWKFLFSAIIAGLCVITRPNVLICIPIIGLLFVYWEWKRKQNLFYGLAIGFIWCLIVCATILPITVRNYIVSGEFVPINSQAGITLYTGNNSHANGFIATTPEIGGWTCFDWPRIVDETNKRIGKELTHAETDKYFARRALKYIKKNPLHTFQLMVKKFCLFWGPKEVCNQKEAECDIRISTVLRFLPVRFSHILTFAILGLAMWLVTLWKCKKNNQKNNCTSKSTQATVWLIIFFTLVYSATFIPFQVAGRYRVPIIPFLIIGASYAVSYFYKLMLRKKILNIIFWSFLAVGLWVVISRNIAGYKPRIGRWYLSRGAAYMLDGKPEKALNNLNRAQELRPHDERIYANIGVVLVSTGDITQAKDYFEKSLNINTNYYRALKNLGLLYARQQKFDSALHYLNRAFKIRSTDYVLARELGGIFGALGNRTNALKYLKQAVELRSEDAKSHYYLGMLCADMEQFKHARNYFETALCLKLNTYDIYFALGRICLKLEDFSSAINYFELAVSLVPNDIQARYLMARAYEQKKLWRKASEIYNLLIEKGVKYPPMLNNYAWLLATAPDKTVRNGETALILAQQACEIADFNNLSFVDTLAAAYAEIGNYSNAIVVLEKYQSLATNSEMKKLVKERLKLYNKKCPVRIK